MNFESTYTIPQPLLQAMVDHIRLSPATQVFDLLLAVKHVCDSQDNERARGEKDAMRRQIEESMKAPKDA